MEFSTSKTITFAVVVCLVCGVFVAGSAVGLKERQKENEVLDRQKKVLEVAGITTSTPEELKATYAARVNPTDVPLVKEGCAEGKKGLTGPAPAGNKAKVANLPNCATIFLIRDAKDPAKTETIILPVEGKGLWSTLYGYIAMDPNGADIKGLTFYKHGETPGLGGEVDNPRWKAQWIGKKAYKPGDAAPALFVQKGKANNEYSVDGLSGATLTSNGVTYLLQFWLSPELFGTYLKSFKG
jgi:Na+-transporting NADH:ubiquinone oxidoreductase subunit C